jgi:hypothetical protein
MNPLWSLFFKDRLRTPFSVYKMSLAELVFLGAVAFGCGFGAVKGSKWLVNLLQNNAVEATVETQPIVETESVVVEAQ